MNTRATSIWHIRDRINKGLKIALVCIVFAGLFSQISMLARISKQSKQLTAVNQQITELNAVAENLEVSLSMYRRLDRIETLAKSMGMHRPDESSIRVVNLPAGYTSDTTMTAKNVSAEGVPE